MTVIEQIYDLINFMHVYNKYNTNEEYINFINNNNKSVIELLNTYTKNLLLYYGDYFFDDFFNNTSNKEILKSEYDNLTKVKIFLGKMVVYTINKLNNMYSYNLNISPEIINKILDLFIPYFENKEYTDYQEIYLKLVDIIKTEITMYVILCYIGITQSDFTSNENIVINILEYLNKIITYETTHKINNKKRNNDNDNNNNQSNKKK